MSKKNFQNDCSAVKMSILQLNKVHICKSVPCDIIDQTWLKIKKNNGRKSKFYKNFFSFSTFFFIKINFLLKNCNDIYVCFTKCHIDRSEVRQGKKHLNRCTKVLKLRLGNQKVFIMRTRQIGIPWYSFQYFLLHFLLIL